MNKLGQGNVMYRGLGSVDFNGSARSVLGVGAVDRKDGLNYHRAIVSIKSNLAAKGAAVLFDLDPERGFIWAGFDGQLSEYNVMTFKQPSAKWHSGGAKVSAKEFLQTELSSGNVSSNEIKAKAKEQGIKSATLERAKKELGVLSKKNNNRWEFVAPDILTKPHDDEKSEMPKIMKD